MGVFFHYSFVSVKTSGDLRIRTISRTIQAISKHIIAKHTLSGACVGVCIDESTHFWIVVPGLQIIQAGLFIVPIAVAGGENAVAYRFQTAKIVVGVVESGAVQDDGTQVAIPGVVSVGLGEAVSADLPALGAEAVVVVVAVPGAEHRQAAHKLLAAHQIAQAVVLIQIDGVIPLF